MVNMATEPVASRVRVKICGITRVGDAAMVRNAGADAIGLVFYPPSPRYVDIDVAAEIAREVGPFVNVVGLFVDADPAFIDKVLARVSLSTLQFHGREPEADCQRYQRPYIKALRMHPGLDVTAGLQAYRSASGILLDAWRKGVPGGTGDTFDWQRVPRESGRPLVLAGGLTPDNVAAAIAATGVYGVDVSGGVESAPGVKDFSRVAEFIQRAAFYNRLTD